MKPHIFLTLLALLCAVSCGRQSNDWSSLDRAIEIQSFYEGIHMQKQDSLRKIYSQSCTDEDRWDAAYELEKIFFYYNIDSCYHYVEKMLSFNEDDTRRRTVSQACKANILYKMDSLSSARKVLEQIDTSFLDDSSLPTYCLAGYHIYRELANTRPELAKKRDTLIKIWWSRDSTNVECTYYRNMYYIQRGEHDKALDGLKACSLKTPNDTAKFHYCMGKNYLLMGDRVNALRHFTISAEYDMKVSAKAYSALYELAMLLFKNGDIRRADRYMRITLQDAQESNYALHYKDIVNSELEIMNVLLHQESRKGWAYFMTFLAAFLLLVVAFISLIVLGGYSSRLRQSRQQLNELSNIKDGFLASYMEKCVDYLHKVDEYRSTLRRTANNQGTEAMMAMLRKPSLATEEFHDLLATFDSTFLGIFPDFVDKVNEHMLPEYKLTMPESGTLSTELRILALIKMGIAKRHRIAKILNMSVTTVYSYHCNLQKHSLHQDNGFDAVIAEL